VERKKSPIRYFHSWLRK